MNIPTDPPTTAAQLRRLYALLLLHGDPRRRLVLSEKDAWALADDPEMMAIYAAFVEMDLEPENPSIRIPRKLYSLEIEVDYGLASGQMILT